MQDFELSRNITIGQYIPTGSIVHRLDPRTKILCAFFLIIAISFNRSIIGNLILLMTVLAIALLSRIPLRYMLRGFLLGLPVLVFIFLVQFLFQGWSEPAGQVFIEWGWLRITEYSLHLVVVSLVRIISFIFLTSLITLTSTITELTHGIEQLLRPFRFIGVPAHELALIFTIALRFVPTLAEEAERIMKAQASRGADLTQRFWQPHKVAKTYLPVIVPLFLSALQRAEELILAMEARCYVSGERRTHFVTLHSTPLDWVVTTLVLAFSVFTIFFPWPAL